MDETAVVDALQDGRDLRAFMNGWYTGVAVVTSAGTGGVPHGLTCTSLTGVALAPPTLLVCLDLRSGTLGAIRQRGGFVVNLLHQRARAVAERFASAEPDRFGCTTWRRSPKLALPWLWADAHAVAECRTTDTHIVGDHAVMFGHVVNVIVDSEPDGRPSPAPLLHGMRTFSRPSGRV